MDFKLHPHFSEKVFLVDLPLCRVFLEDECHYPWILLIPRRENISRIMDLASVDQVQLLTELDLGQKVLWDTFHPTQINVAAIGNKTPQLHVHVIARFETDPAWPGTVWDHQTRKRYPAKALDEMKNLLQQRFQRLDAISLCALPQMGS